MLAAGQVVATDRAVGHQLAALVPPGRVNLAAEAPVASAEVFLPRGHVYLEAASAASLRHWTTLTPLETRPVL